MIPRIGYVQAPPEALVAARTNAFRQGFHDLGYIEGKNIAIDWRYADGKVDRVPALVAAPLNLNVDVIVSGGWTVTRSAKEATKSIPIVMAQEADPLGNGFVTSLARPGVNVTGLPTLAPELTGKQFPSLLPGGDGNNWVPFFGFLVRDYGI